MRDGDQVKHYRIRKSDDGGFFIARANVFGNLQELVVHYQNSSDGLCGLLRKPCERVRNEKKNREKGLFIYFLRIFVKIS